MKSLPVLREQLHVSVSQLKTYLTCPRRYELSYVRGVEPAFTPVALAFGSAFHTAIGHYYRALQISRCPPPLEAVIQAFSDDWKARANGPFPLQDDEAGAAVDHVERAAKMLETFYSQATAAPLARVEAVEMAFSIEVRDPETGEPLEERLVGAFDLVLVSKRTRTIVEFKTSAKRYGKDQVDFDLQPTAYRMAARQLGFGEVAMQLEVYTKTKIPSAQIEVLRRGPDDEEDLLRTLSGVLRAIDGGVFHRARGWACRSCPVSHACIPSR